MIISAIKAQVKNPDRVSIYVDGKYSFSLSTNQLLEHKLHSGLELSEDDLAKLKYASDYGKTYDRALNYLMIRPRSAKELSDYLWRKKVEPELATSVLNKLQARGYVNDAAFAKSWVRARQLTKPVSKRRLVAELRQKGVGSDIIEQALSGDEPYDEHEALREMVAKKRRLARFANDDQKLMQYLARQGFSYDEIKQALGR